MSTNITIERTKTPKEKPSSQSLGFGKYFTDHMFSARYSAGRGWHEAKITPYQALPLDPGASVLHYGQALFEGMKAFRHSDGQCVMFRPEFNWQRMVDGAERLCMQAPPKELFLQGIAELIRVDQDWIPREKGCSLYIRPTLIGTEAFLGVRPAEEYLFFTILSPVGNYYGDSNKPVKIWVEEEFVRAAPGGLGATKAAANYAASLKAAYAAKKNSYAQVLWLDVTREYVEEVGTMNVFFVFEDEIVTPSLGGTILGGGTRHSIITLLKGMNKPIVERRIKLSELREGAKTGRLKEIFGTGTAAIISPVGELAAKDWNIVVNNNEIGPIAAHLYEELLGIQQGTKKDPHGWLYTV
ncbi:branched-chain amino acid aminotransferase [Bdellovibrio sp. 22V]|uniref:branched-chain amino acid aminotransferase n=1 Tax=Bdellovibrio TaxID=958 RepID=UPI002543C23B|nr:branched-chain amino acid aminotransferase [Bdellovibrio sp. 22V]WII72442.1 branched-chain amino acid aminotransferase [Bdellovibrio sp. 22V]